MNIPDHCNEHVKTVKTANLLSYIFYNKMTTFKIQYIFSQKKKKKMQERNRTVI